MKNKSLLYNRGSKRYVAKLLSTKAHPFTKHDLNKIIYDYDYKTKVFYENKKTKERYKRMPSDYTTKKYRKFTDVPEPRKSALKQLNKYLSELSIPYYVFAKTNGGYYKNAKWHIGNTNFLLIDIASFYPNCKFKYVKAFFMSPSGFRMKNDLAQCMSELVTVPESDNPKIRIIPQGFSTSTLISFFSYKKMFEELNKLALKNNFTFSTYVDDVTFSSKNNSFDFNSILPEIDIILGKYGHKRKIEKTKIYLIDNGDIPTITGVMVKRYKLNASKKIYKKMIKNYRWLISNKIVDGTTYIQAWKHFDSFKGLLATINYIEKSSTSNVENRKYLEEYVKKNDKYFIASLSPYTRKYNSNYWKGKFYGAYINNNIEEFYKANKKILCKKQ